jgi:hypothetical protein
MGNSYQRRRAGTRPPDNPETRNSRWRTPAANGDQREMFGNHQLREAVFCVTNDTRRIIARWRFHMSDFI